MPTGPDVLRAWFGANAAGAVYSPLNLAARGSYLQHTLNLAEVEGARRPSRPRRSARRARPAAPRAGRARRRPRRRRAPLADRHVGRAPRRRRATSGPALPRPVEPWDDLSLIYTSGTTGPSKGVRASHAAFWNYGNCFIAPFVDESDRYLQPLPMFYTAGTGHHVLDAPGRRLARLTKGFSSTTFWDDVRRFEATITIAIHGMVTFMLDQPVAPDDADNPLRVVYMGPLTRHEEFARALRLPHLHRLRDDRGAGADRLRRSTPDDGRSCGRAADPVHYELRLVDENDVPVPPGTPGELDRAPHAAVDDQLGLQEHAGGDRERLAQRLVPYRRPVHAGRGRELLLPRPDQGRDPPPRRNISSFEVEEEVLSHPLVKDVAAVAVRNPDLEESAGDEEVKVAVVLEDGRGARPRRARRVPRARACRGTGCRASSSSFRSCRARSRTR